MKVWKVIYAAIGIILAAGSIATAQYGLSEVNKDIFQNALALDERMQTIGFGDFTLKGRKVRFYDGDCDYVAWTDENDTTVIKKEKAQLDVFAGTTLNVDGEWQALVPTYEHFSGLIDTLGAMGSYEQGMQEGSFAFSESGYGKEEKS